MKLEIVRIAQFTMDSDELETIGAAVNAALASEEYDRAGVFSPEGKATLQMFQVLGEQAFNELRGESRVQHR